MSEERQCPSCGRDLRIYSLEGSIRRAVKGSNSAEEWALNGDCIDTDYEACTAAEHAYCEKCSFYFNVRNGDRYAEDPIPHIQRAAEYIMGVLAMGKLPRIPGDAVKEARAPQPEDFAGDPNLLP